VARTRRYQASKLAKRESIPATVRELTDAQALELQVIELSVVGKAFLHY
jgi:ParB-like chromosome segregation protein Spo0J